MPSSKRRKTSEVSTKEVVSKEYDALSEPEIKDDKRREDVFFPELSNAPENVNSFGIATQNINVESDILVVRYPPTLRTFVSVRTPNPMVRIKLNLPNLAIPPRLLQPEENALTDLRILLKNIGFDVVDRATLAFFAIGSELDIPKAARRFVNIHRFLITVECKSPSREILESMQNSKLIEGFVRHQDGTFGTDVHVEKWDPHILTAPYIAREMFCYIFSMVDLSLIRNGMKSVINARNVSWRVFQPLEMAKLGKICINLPLTLRGRYMIDAGVYGRLAHKVCKPLLVVAGKVTVLLSEEEFRVGYPHLVLPESITGLSDNKLIKHLSVEEQFKMKLLLESSN